ncbi:MFS transporter [Acinetobacter sp. ANC 4558]|uniref:MFS transporter n=1 Tax=Acinetobacter sp. ANC 4558 TaxID=1977876 RepID=UPI000A337FCE|nr:MFS transporter [Acinetobacter sp. ANC 4558]OTG87044.1 MFS transporter [Acinetobacter sp. ANC 4558]
MLKSVLDLNNKSSIVILGLMITLMASSIKGLYQVYFVDLLDIYQMSRAQLSLLGAIFGLFVGIFSPITGYICDKYGPLKTILSGIVVAIVLFGLISINQSQYILFLSLGVLAAYAITAMTFIPFAILVDSIFKDENKGMAFAILSNGTAIGFIVLSPLWVYFSTFLSWQYSNFIVFLLFLIVILPCGLLLNKKVIIPAKKKESLQSKPKVLKELTSFNFLFLTLSFGGCGMAMAFIDVHLLPLIKENKTFFLFDSNTTLIATALSTLGIAEIIGSIFIAIIIRYANLYLTLAALYLVRCLLFIYISIFNTDLSFLAFAFIFGLTYMGTVIISSLLCLKWYGAQIKGQIFGYLFLFHQIFVFISVWSGGIIYDFNNNYTLYLLMLSLISLTSIFASLFLFFKHYTNKPLILKEIINDS